MDRGKFGNVRMGDLRSPRINLSGRTLRLIPAVILSLMLLYTSVYTVSSEETDSGLYFKLPAPIQSVQKVRVLPHG